MDVSFENKDVYILETVRKLSISLHALINKYPIQSAEIRKYWGPCYFLDAEKAMSDDSARTDAEFINDRFNAALDFLYSIEDVEITHYGFVLLTLAHFLNYSDDEAMSRIQPFLLEPIDMEKKEFIMTGAVLELFRQATVPYIDLVGQTSRTTDVLKNQVVDKALKHLRSHFFKTMAVFREMDFETAAGRFNLNTKLSFCHPVIRTALGLPRDRAIEENLYDSSVTILSSPIRASKQPTGAVPRQKEKDLISWGQSSQEATEIIEAQQQADLADIRQQNAILLSQQLDDQDFRIEEEQRKIKAQLEREEQEKQNPPSALASFVFSTTARDEAIAQRQKEEDKRRADLQASAQRAREIHAEEAKLAEAAREIKAKLEQAEQEKLSLAAQIEAQKKEEEKRKQKEAEQKKKDKEEAKQKEKEKKELQKKNLAVLHQMKKDDEEREKLRKEKDLLEQDKRNLQEAIRRSTLESGAAVLNLKKQMSSLEAQKEEELVQEKDARAFAEAEREKERKKTEEYRLREFQKEEEFRKKQKEFSIAKEMEVLQQKKENERLIKELEKMKALKKGEYGCLDTPVSRDRFSTPLAPSKARRNLSFDLRADSSFAEQQDDLINLDESYRKGDYHEENDYFEEHSHNRNRSFERGANLFDDDYACDDEGVCYFPDDPLGPARADDRRENARLRNTFRKTERNEFPSKIRTPHIDYFDFNLQGQTISEILGARFYRYRFHDEVERELTKKTILERVLLSNDSGELAKHLALRGLGDFNATNFHQRGVDLTAMISRQCIAEAANPRCVDNRIPPPKLGTNNKCQPSVLKGLNTTLLGDKFCPENGKPIDFFLSQVSSTISMYKFDQSCAYEVLKFVLKHQSPLYNVVAEEQKKETPFLQVWNYVQTSMAPSFNGEKIENQIKKLLATRPAGSLGPHLIAIHDLAIQKYAPNQNQKEKDTQVFYLARDLIFAVLQKHYPYMLQHVIDAFRKVERMKETRSGVYRDQYGPIDLDQTDRVKTLIQVISNLERDHALTTGGHSAFISTAQFFEETPEASINTTSASSSPSAPAGSAPVTKADLDEALASIAANDVRNRPRGPKQNHFNPNHHNNHNNGPSKVEKQLDELTSMVCTLNSQNTNLQHQIAQSKASSQSLAPAPAPAPQQGFFAPQSQTPATPSPVTQTLAPPNTYSHPSHQSHQSAQAQQMTAQAYQGPGAPQYQQRNPNQGNGSGGGGSRGGGFGRGFGGYQGGSGGYRRNGDDANFTPRGGGYQGNRPRGGGFGFGFGGFRPRPQNDNQRFDGNQRPFNDNRNFGNQQPRGGFNPRFNNPPGDNRTRRPADPSWVCDLCGFKASHLYPQCYKYPNMEPSGPQCTVCNGRHPVPCRANIRNPNQNQNQQPQQQQAPPQGQAQPQRGPGGFLGNSGQQPLPQHVTMHASQVEYQTQGFHSDHYPQEQYQQQYLTGQ